jgi:diguanylate cyclase (GGDEF)-like protein/PAS domain S-box-containing protein
MNAPTPLAQLALLGLPASTAMTALMTQTRHAVVVTDAQRRITWMNEGFSRLTGWPADEAMGRSPGELLQCSDTDPAQRRRIRAMLDAGQSFHGVVLNCTRQGRRYWADLDIHPIAPDDGPVHGFVAIVLDLSFRQVAVDQLRATLDSAASGFVVQDARGRIVDLNPAAESLLGLTRDQLMGVASIDPRWRATRADGSELPGDQHPAMRTLRTGQPVLGETMGIALPDGSRRWLLVNANILPRGENEHWVISSFVDLTAQRALEQDLADQKGRLQALFEHLPLGLTLYDMDRGLVLDCNAAMSRINGFSWQEIVTGIAQQHVPPEHADVRANWMQLARERSHFGPLESVILHKSGRRVDVRLSGAVASEPGGRRLVWLLIEDISLRKRAERALVASAERDRLTDLPNRVLLSRQIEQQIERARHEAGYGFAVLFLDFDRFKLVNDTLGHDAGDELLRSIASRLHKAMQVSARLVEALNSTGDAEAAGWMAARFGGDEFVLVAPGLNSELAAASFAEVVLNHLSRPHRIKGMDIPSSASIGIAFGSAQSADASSIIRDADTAMYEAKHKRHSGYVFFDSAMRLKLTRSLQIEEALSHALARGELRLVYQPIIDLETGEPYSAEALLRWQHPTLGDISPSEFIPVAEESGQIIALGRWVLFESCAAWSRWQARGAAHVPCKISVNLARAQMADGLRLLATVRSALDAHHMPPQRLQLEITEREVMKDPEAARELVQALRELGVVIAMDDFGTGTSSLACLREYPFDTVKVDKSFVTNLCTDPQVMAVAHATVSVIENLGMLSVAEGIETEAEVAALQSMGCRYGQGYLFGRPMTEDELMDLFNRG